MVLEDHGPRGQHSLGALTATAKHRSLELDLWRLWEWVSEIAWKVWIGYLGSTLDPGRNLWRPATLFKGPSCLCLPIWDYRFTLLTCLFYMETGDLNSDLHDCVSLNPASDASVSFFLQFWYSYYGEKFGGYAKIKLLVISNVIV